MDLGVFLATFGAIFLAELADKTQLVGIGMSARSGKPITVFFASVLAYAVITGISVYLGALLGKNLKPEIIRYAGGAVFILIGLLIFTKKL